MAIPASELVKIQPRVLAGTGQDLAFNGLFLTDNALAPADTLLKFYDAASVGDYFGTASDDYKAANVYFGGYNNSFLKPTAVFFYRANTTAIAPFVRSQAFEAGTVDDLLTALKAISEGTFTASIGSAPVSLTKVDFSAVTSISQACETLQTAIRAAAEVEAVSGATVSWNPVLRAFTVTAGATGAEVSLSDIAGTVADAMHLSKGFAPVVSEGADAANYTDIMTDVTDHTQNFVTYSTVKEVTGKEDALALAGWANTQYNAGNQYLYVFWSNDAALKTTEASDTIAAAIAAAEYNGTTGIYGDVRYPAFLMGTAASIDWDRLNGAITTAFKAQSGLEANVTVKKDAANLLANGVNFMGNYASRNDNFILFQNGQMFGAWKWIDTYLNSTWLNNALQVQIMAGLELAGRVPYNEVGYSKIRAWCQDVIDRGVNNGVIDRGVNLSQTQINELINEAGKDISADLYANGYVLQIVDATANIRQARTSPSCNFWYTYAGSVHKINLPSTAVV